MSTHVQSIALGDHVHVIGTKWYSREGNTYHRAEIRINGRFVHKTEMAYGSGDHYEQSAREWLIANNYMDEPEGHPSLFRVIEGLGATYESESRSVKRKKDL